MEKKNIFLSFKPEYFRPILYDIKKYEYRKRFCKESVRAFLYLSRPVQEVIGIVELGEPIELEKLISKFNKGTIEYERINNCLINKEKLAIPIKSLKLYKEPVSISKLKEVDAKFFVPQSYLFLDKKKELLEYLEKQVTYTEEFENSHNNIYAYNIGMSCKEMEETLEFKQKDKMYLKNKKYSNVKSGYINEE